MSLINSFQFCICLLAVGLTPGNKIPEKDGVVDNLDVECKECTIVVFKVCLFLCVEHDMSFETFLAQLGIKSCVLVIICYFRKQMLNVVLQISTVLNGHDGEGLEGRLVKIDNLSFGWC